MVTRSHLALLLGTADFDVSLISRTHTSYSCISQFDRFCHSSSYNFYISCILFTQIIITRLVDKKHHCVLISLIGISTSV